MGLYIGNVYDFMNRSSLIPNLHKKSLEEKLNIVSDFALLSKEDQECLEKQIVLHENGTDSCDNESDKAIENIISAYSLPIGLATHFKINGCEYLIPMVLHTPSIVSIVSNAAKTAKVRGGFTAMVNGNTCRGQIQLLEVPFSFSEICNILLPNVTPSYFFISKSKLFILLSLIFLITVFNFKFLFS